MVVVFAGVRDDVNLKSLGAYATCAVPAKYLTHLPCLLPITLNAIELYSLACCPGKSLKQLGHEWQRCSISSDLPVSAPIAQ